MKHLFLVLLITVSILGFGLRVWQLDSLPYGGLVDEVSIGYNAWSIAETGKDEHGVRFPVLFKAFGDQKLPAYIYSVVPFISILGPSNLAVRLPSAVAGSILILVAYGLARSFKFSKPESLLGATIIAFSPWPFVLSRFGFESNLALLFWMLGLTAVVQLFQPQRSSRTKVVLAVVAGVLFALTMYSYVAYRVSVILFLFFMTIFTLVKNSARKNLAFFVFLLGTTGTLMLPILPSMLSKAGTARFSQIGLLGEPGPIAFIVEQRMFCAEKAPATLCYLIYNKPTVWATTMIERSFSFLSPQYLFFSGDQFLPYLGPNTYGQFPIAVAVLFYAGLFFLVRTKSQKGVWVLATGIILLGMIPMALAGEPQKIRASFMLPGVLLLILLGSRWLLQQHRAFSVLILTAALWGSAGFFLNWFTVHPFKMDTDYNSPARKLFEYLKQEHSGKTIEMDRVLSDAVIYYAFYTMVPPQRYQETLELGTLEPSGFQHADAVSGFRLRSAEFTGQGDPCTTYVTGRDLTLPASSLKTTIRTENGVHPVYFVYQVPTLTPVDCELPTDQE